MIDHRRILTLLFLFFLLTVTNAQIVTRIPLLKNNLDAIHVKAEVVRFKGKNAIHIVGTESGEQVAIVKGVDFKNGSIEIDMAGQPLSGSDASFRGFIGIAFHVQKSDTLRYECFYLRPTNGRAEDQLRRNHSVQYISHPGFPWAKLRKENPGSYESYVDLVAGQWTKVKVLVKDNDARLFVNDANQPCLIVKDLKRSISNGGIALWIGPGTDGYFTNLKIKSD
jgi:hypothetical protein